MVPPTMPSCGFTRAASTLVANRVWKLSVSCWPPAPIKMWDENNVVGRRLLFGRGFQCGLLPSLKHFAGAWISTITNVRYSGAITNGVLHPVATKLLLYSTKGNLSLNFSTTKIAQNPDRARSPLTDLNCQMVSGLHNSFARRFCHESFGCSHLMRIFDCRIKPFLEICISPVHCSEKHFNASRKFLLPATCTLVLDIHEPEIYNSLNWQQKWLCFIVAAHWWTVFRKSRLKLTGPKHYNPNTKKKTNWNILI